MTNGNQPTTDPFFTLPRDSEWNACIGVQGDEQHYVDGYIEAALELTRAVLDKRLYGQRDTLVLPILYNARHGVELALKFVIGRLHQMGVITQPRSKDHHIGADYALLRATRMGDEALRGHVAALERFVQSLTGIDDDGQMLRYAKTQDGKQSLGDRSLVNIAVIDASLKSLKGVLDSLKVRVIEIEDERRTGSFTADCSRMDLFEIAKMLPPRAEWSGEAFTAAKDAVKARYGIGSNKFSDAVIIIEKHRELGVHLGLSFPLAHLTDDHAKLAVSEWTKRHPDRGENLPAMEWGSEEAWQAMRDDGARAKAVNEAIIAALSAEELADLETIFYVGRDRVASEYYADRLARTLKEHSGRERYLIIDRLTEKTNLQTNVAEGVGRLGRPDLTEQLRAIGH